MRRNYTPTKSERVENKKKESTHNIPIIDKTLFDKKFHGKIRFQSRKAKYIFMKVREDTYDTKFGVFIKRFIPLGQLYDLIEGMFAEGCKVYIPLLYRPYRLSHSFEVKLSKPMTWGEFQHRIVKALEEIL